MDRRRRRGGPARPAGPERARQPVRQTRRFEVDEEEIEEGLSELHGDTYDDDDVVDEDDSDEHEDG